MPRGKDHEARFHLALLLLLGAVSVAGCGGDDAPEPPERTATEAGTTTAQTVPEEEPSSTDDRVGGEASKGEPAEEAPEAGEPAEGDGGSGACEYSAPPGRLGNRTVSIELSGTSCDVGRRLAKAAALGQPAAANIPVSADGFRCEPSTRDRGVNVVYACENGSRSASFEIEWTAG